MSKTFAIYVITKHGMDSGRKLHKELPDSDIFVSPKFADVAPEGAKPLSLPMGPTLQENFEAYDCHIFVISVGAVVRMIAPLMKSKKTDPAVICVDDGARFSICVLSGHVGRGNEFTDLTADILDATSVVTTASDVRGTLTVDILGRELGWTLNDMDHNVTRGCAAVVNEKRVLFVQEAGEPNWWPLNKKLPPGLEYRQDLRGVAPEDYEIVLVASDRLLDKNYPDLYANAVLYRPKSLVLGLGCDKNTPFELVERGVMKLLEDNDLSLDCVKEIASIDLKANEPAFLELSSKYSWPFRLYDAETLDVVPGIENPSETVKKYVGTRAVAEPAALLAAGADKLTLAKMSYTEPDAGRNMTMAVARIPFAPRDN